MGHSKYLALIIFIFIINHCPDALTQDLNSYRESFKSNNYYTIVEKADKYWKSKDVNKEEYREEYKNYIRWKTFTSRRFGDDGYLSAYPIVLREYFTTKRNTSRLKSIGDLSFTYLGPIGIPPSSGVGTKGSTGKGWINCLYVDTTDNDIIFAGTHNSGLWKTNNGGDSWTLLTRDYPLISGIYSIVFNPNNKNEIFVLTGIAFGGHYSLYSHGVFKTTDGGSTWSEVTIEIEGEDFFPNNDIYKHPRKLIMHPTDTSILLLLTKAYIFKTTDYGSTWSIKYDGSSNKVDLADIEFRAGTPSTMFASGDIILWSMNSGSIWSTITNSVIGLDTIHRAVIGVHDNYPGVEWYYYDTIGSTRKFLKKNESGTFKLLHEESSITGYNTMNIAISSNDSGIVYLGAAYHLYKYKNSPPDFVSISNSTLTNDNNRYGPSSWIHADIRDIVVIDNDTIDNVYVGHDGGVSWAMDTSSSDLFDWVQFSDDSTSGLQITEFYGLAGVESNPNLLFGGCQDLSSFIYDNGTWNHDLGGDVGKTLIDFNNTENFIMLALL